jgi:hypothetical protein
MIAKNYWQLLATLLTSRSENPVDGPAEEYGVAIR